MESSDGSVASASMRVAWDPAGRLVTMRCKPGALLDGTDAGVFVDAISAWIGETRAPFGLLAYLKDVRGTDAECRTTARSFFSRHKDYVSIATLDTSPILRVVTDMFRIGSGVQVEAFASEAEARAWLRDRGVGA